MICGIVYRGSLGALSSVALAKDDASEWEGKRVNSGFNFEVESVGV